MKKTIILMTLCLVAFCCPVQAQHFKFMGIPLNGTITQFQQKLANKGIKYDKTLSAQLSIGTRAFSGTFAGEEATIYVYYNPSTKIVYSAKAVIDCSSESISDNKYSEMKSLLSSKYIYAETEEGYKEGHEKMTYYIYDDGITSYNTLHGVIVLYVTKAEYSSIRFLHIEYADIINGKKNNDSKMEDL